VLSTDSQKKHLVTSLSFRNKIAHINYITAKMANVPTTCFNLFPYTSSLFCHTNNNNNASGNSSPRTSPISSTRELNRSSFSIDSILGFGGTSGNTRGQINLKKEEQSSNSRSNSCSPTSPPSPRSHLHNNNNNGGIGGCVGSGNKINITGSGSGGTICGGNNPGSGGVSSSPSSGGTPQQHHQHYSPFPFLHHPAFHLHNQQAAAEILGKFQSYPNLVIIKDKSCIYLCIIYVDVSTCQMYQNTMHSYK